jgi:acyl carrier protein
MNDEELLKALNEVFIKTLDNERIVLSSETTARDIEEWDSLRHIQLIVAMEKYFRIRFTSREIQRWKNVGEIMISIKSKAIGIV